MAEEVQEEQLETLQEDEKSRTKKTPLKSAGEVIVEGKRAKKSVERLDFQVPKHKEKLRIAEGSGDKLGDIPRTNFQISKLKPADLKPLHAILFERPGKMATMKKNLRLFNGFPFNAGSEQYLKKREKLLRNSHLTNAKLKVVCGVLDLEKKGTHSDLVDRILMFLLAPKNSGKRLPVKKKKRSKKKVTADQSTAKSKKKSNAKTGRSSSSSSSPKKSKAGSKSNAIVMDSSSDDEEDEDEEEKAAEEDRSSKKDEDSSEQSADEEITKSKKRSRTPTKKTPHPKKRLKTDLSDDDLDSDSAEKKTTTKKPGARTKKADSSSRNTNTDTSDEDEPLSRMIKRAPSDEQLKETVRALLKDADLEEMTMKQICQKVFDTYPDHDLTGRKDFIKQSVKSIIT
uniref:protein DEK isoform X2 n=1 Tax=Doryrhamphus excisus TaxID=161450 RepID=UPI0025AE006F|nr:protein DEK isoform X2 [Doryrhamphus excisus]